MADINRLPLAALLPLALVALTACGTGSGPAAEATAMQPAAPAEGAAKPDALQLRRTGDGGVEIRKVDVPVDHAGQAAEAAPAAPAEPAH